MSPDQPHVEPPAFDEAERALRLAYLGFEDRDGALLHDLEDIFAPRLNEIADRFYAHLLNFEETRNVFKDDAMVQRLKEAQKAYLMQAVRGPYDAVYFERRWRIGYIHNVIGLEPRWFVGAFKLYHRILFPYIQERYDGDVQSVLDHILALDKIMALDMIVGLESYWIHYTAAMERIHTLNAEIQAASAAKSQFLANMSHEFRTPLNAIIGFTEVLQDKIAGPLNDEQTEYLADIHDAGKLLLRLINDVLDIAKIEAGRLELYYETFPIAQIIRDGITTLRPAAEKKGLQLNWELPPDLGVISADQIRLKQVIFNLLSNAVKFTDSGSVTVSARREDGNFHLVVLDTGIGIRAEDHDRIFVEFSQVDASHGRKYEGTGLGLSLSKRLVEAHGGKIWFESVPGKGSVFHVLMPLKPMTESGSRAEQAARQGAAP